MNPSKALAAWGPPALADARAPVSAADALAAWSAATGVYPEASWVGAGVRDLLQHAVPAFDALVDEYWIPEDVYPVYATILGSRRRSEYGTFPGLGWGRLAEASSRAAVLCPVPLSPLGRFPTRDEVTWLARWLSSSEERYLLLDAAYAYDFPTLARVIAPLVEAGRTVVFFSCNKSWLLPSALGVASLTNELQARLAGPKPQAPSRLAGVADWLAKRPNLPRAQQQAFSREWQRLAPRIRAAAATWQPPECGYFSVIDVAFDALLDRHDILAVPASVFGSSRRDHSVLACLHDLVAHEQGDA